MRRIIGIVISSIVFLIISNIYYYRDTYNWQLNTQKNLLLSEITTCKEQLTNYFSEVETNVLLLLNENELGELFDFKLQSQEPQKRIELLYNRYNNILQELAVYDIKGNYYSLIKRKNNSLVSKYGKSNRKEEFKASLIINPSTNSIIYTQPIYGETHIFGYVVFKLNLNHFYGHLFKNFTIEGHQLQWITNHNQEIIYSTESNTKLPQKNKLNLNSKSALHNLLINNKEVKVISVFETIKTGNKPLSMAFSMPIKPITFSILKNSFLVAAISFIVIFFIIFAFYQYILKSKKSEQLTLQSENALGKILHYLPVGVVLTDAENKVKLVNKTALKLFNCDDEDVLTEQYGSAEILFEKKKILETIKISDSSNKYILNNGNNDQQIILSEKIPFYIQSKNYTINVYIEFDPSELTNNSNANNPKTTFIANISHELRTPLNGILGMTDLLLSSNNIPDTEQEMLKVAKRSADTLLALINDILDFSKIEAGKLEIESIPINLKGEIDAIINDFSSISKDRKIMLDCKSNTDLPSDFLGDPLRLRQVLNNLIGNAIKFTTIGNVRLTIDKTVALKGNPALLFTISDTGIGIRKSKLETIFNSFSQEDESTTRKFGGTGLGTSISKNLVELMGGEIWANSPSKILTNTQYPGSDFCFTLPLEIKRKQKHLDFSYVLSWTQLTALIITDDALQVQNIIKNLMALGINYKVMAPSQETLIMLDKQNNIQLIIIDQRPDFNGIDFLQELYSHSLYKKYLIILQSSDYETMNTNIGKKLGADIYLRKPVKLQNIQNFILRNFPAIKLQNSLVGQVVPENLKILVAEDNLFNQKVAQNLFEKIGFNIDLAHNGREAINKYKLHKYDIIFMDLMMPELDGFDATKELKCYNESCPIIAMTANNDKKQRELAFKSGMDDFIVKPAQKDEIMRMIIKWCSE
ncbi:response regulator [Labilibacter sediminis]|nr:response regulator [Labilibacter sediminis]